MQRFQNILVYPVGLYAGDPAISSATDLAERTGAELTIVWVLKPEERWLERRRRRRQARLDRLASELRVRRVRATGVVLVGKKASAVLIEEICARQIDLVIKAARPSDDPEARAFSSIAKDLLRGSPCPVWIVRGATDDAEPVILAAVEPFHYEPQSGRLDRGVLEVAVQLAEIRGAKLHVVSAWAAVGAGLLRNRLSRADYLDYMRASEADARRELHEFLKPYGIPSRRIHLRRGAVGSVIATVADETSAELVVVGSAGRKGLRRWFAGNTVEEVLDESITAVLGVRDTATAADARA